MTIEERWKHIEVLSDLRAKYSCFEEGEEPYYKALSAGIKALKQELCVTMRDLSEEELKHFAEEMKKVRPQVIERESILDKIKDEIKVLSPEPTAYDVVDGNPVKDAVWETLIEVDKIIDKYKAESEE